MASAKLFVGGVHHEITSKQFEDYFKSFGEIEDIILLSDPDNPSGHRGYGFVQYVNKEDADKVRGQKHQLGKKELDINEAKPKSKKLFIGNLKKDGSVTEEMIRTAFEEHGEILEIDIPKDNGKGPRGFAFVTIIDDGSNVKNLVGQKIDVDGVEADVNFAHQKGEEQNSGFGYGGYGGYGGFGGYGGYGGYGGWYGAAGYGAQAYGYGGGRGGGRGRGRGRGGRGRGARAYNPYGGY